MVSTSEKLISLQNFQVAIFCYLLFNQVSNEIFQVANLPLATVNFKAWSIHYVVVVAGRKYLTNHPPPSVVISQ